MVNKKVGSLFTKRLIVGGEGGYFHNIYNSSNGTKDNYYLQAYLQMVTNHIQPQGQLIARQK